MPFCALIFVVTATIAPTRCCIAYMSAAGDPVAATAWLVDLSSVAPDPASVLADIVEANWIPVEQRAPIYRRVLELKQAALTRQGGLEKEGLEKAAAEQDLRSWQVRWIKYLVVTKQYAAAGASLSALSKQTRETEANSPHSAGITNSSAIRSVGFHNRSLSK